MAVRTRGGAPRLSGYLTAFIAGAALCFSAPTAAQGPDGGPDAALGRGAAPIESSLSIGETDGGIGTADTEALAPNEENTAGSQKALGRSEEPLVLVRVESSAPCPTRDRVVAELRGLVDVVDSAAAGEAQDSQFVLEVRRARGGARMKLVEGETHSVALVRRLRSRDCVAIARAVSLIVERHLLELHLPVGVRQADAAASQAGAAAEVTVEMLRDAEQEPRGEATTIAAAASAAGPSEAADIPSYELASLLLGARVAIDPGSVSGALQLGLGWSSPLGPLVRLQVGLVTPRTEETQGERLELFESRAELELGWDLWPGPGVAAAVVGGGARIVRASAVDLVGRPGKTRAMAVFSLAGLFLVPVGPVLFGTEISASVTPDRDRYRIEPSGVITSASRFEGSVLVGLFVPFAL